MQYIVCEGKHKTSKLAFLFTEKKIRLDFLHSAYITDDTLIQNYRRTLPNSKISDYPNISIDAHTLLGYEIAETSHDVVRTATSTSDGPAQK